MRSTGLIQKWTEMYFPIPKLCDKNTGPRAFSITDIKSVFLILIAGLGFSTIILGVEKFLHFYKNILDTAVA